MERSTAMVKKKRRVKIASRGSGEEGNEFAGSCCSTRSRPLFFRKKDRPRDRQDRESSTKGRSRRRRKAGGALFFRRRLLEPPPKPLLLPPLQSSSRPTLSLSPTFSSSLFSLSFPFHSTRTPKGQTIQNQTVNPVCTGCPTRGARRTAPPRASPSGLPPT